MANETETAEWELESTSGGIRRLSEYRRRVVVLFWEDRDHQRDNLDLKDELGSFASDPELRRRVAVVAVGDVSRFDFAPAREIVRATLTMIARAIGIEILLDWKGVLARPPFDLVCGQSNVVVLDGSGRAVLRKSGRLSAADRAEVIATVRALMA